MQKPVALLGVMLLSGTLSAQETSPPADWKFRLDDANASAAEFKMVTMAPGWHVTTGPPGIAYRQDTKGEGNYRIEATIYLFDPGKRHHEAYGIIFGGRNLESKDQQYSYFLIRDTGEFLIKRRSGSSTSTVKGWTPAEGIMKFPGGDKQAENTLAIAFGADTVDFLINGATVASVPRSDLDAEGVVGLRVNHALQLHIQSLEIK